jgi:hypothetical protein
MRMLMTRVVEPGIEASRGASRSEERGAREQYYATGPLLTGYSAHRWNNLATTGTEMQITHRWNNLATTGTEMQITHSIHTRAPQLDSRHSRNSPPPPRFALLNLKARPTKPESRIQVLRAKGQGARRAV